MYECETGGYFLEVSHYWIIKKCSWHLYTLNLHLWKEERQNQHNKKLLTEYKTKFPGNQSSSWRHFRQKHKPRVDLWLRGIKKNRQDLSPGNMNIRTIHNGNPSSSWDISVQDKMTDNVTTKKQNSALQKIQMFFMTGSLTEMCDFLHTPGSRGERTIKIQFEFQEN